MKKILLLLLLLLSYEAAYASGTGFLTKLNITEEDYGKMLLENRKQVGWQFLTAKHSDSEHSFKFYDSLMELEFALQRGDIDEIIVPSVVAEYMLNANKKFAFNSVEKVMPISLVFGFRAKDVEMRDKFNLALKSMKEDGELLRIINDYLVTPGFDEPEPVEFDKFADAEVIRVAVTGDMPPIDLVNAGGTPAGFNTAVIAEIGRRLKANVVLMDIDAGARAAALASGRVNAVFWYFKFKAADGAKEFDVPEGVILSEPYYEFDKFIHVKFRAK